MTTVKIIEAKNEKITVGQLPIGSVFVAQEECKPESDYRLFIKIRDYRDTPEAMVIVDGSTHSFSRDKEVRLVDRIEAFFGKSG